MTNSWSYFICCFCAIVLSRYSVVSFHNGTITPNSLLLTATGNRNNFYGGAFIGDDVLLTRKVSITRAIKMSIFFTKKNKILMNFKCGYAYKILQFVTIK